ncbi:MAG: galactose mutarotase [Cyclobacteriaceae bacterium]|jgi:aldose 1-epimerase|nr:galactose mutarotase [Cyclobacteriaceae bacterium]
MKRHFGNLPTGVPIYEYTISNNQGVKLSAINLGGIITALYIPFKSGETNVVLRFDNIKDYLPNKAYIGAIIGRFANRIDRGRFNFNDVHYKLSSNAGVNHLHGGRNGFDQQFWRINPVSYHNNPALELRYTSLAGEEGYPGEVEVKVIYVLDNLALRVIYEAQTTAATPVSLTQHSYFNLSGDFSQTVLDHQLKVNATAFAPINELQIPLGYLQHVQDTPFDLRHAAFLSDILKSDDPQLKIAEGLDHSWKNPCNLQLPLAEVLHEKSKRGLTLYTTQPAIHIYTGNFLPEIEFPKHAAFCLETQHFPDAVNKPILGNPFLQPGDRYSHETIFSFFNY